MARNVTRCDCGRIKSKWSPKCKRCTEAHLATLRAEAQKIVATGKCPDCGRGLRQNLSMIGWWQCEQYGAEGFRKDSTQPSCDFQTFTR